MQRSVVVVLTDAKDELLQPLPPFVVLNPRERVMPELIPLDSNYRKHEVRVKEIPAWRKYALEWIPDSKPALPIPKHPIFLSWRPKALKFMLDKEPLIHTLWITNSSLHIIYVHCCGLRDDTARMGASWYLHPKTRMLLAPGMSHEICVKAVPRESSPVREALIGLQLATAMPRDIVVEKEDKIFYPTEAIKFKLNVPKQISSKRALYHIPELEKTWGQLKK